MYRTSAERIQIVGDDDADAYRAVAPRFSRRIFEGTTKTVPLAATAVIWVCAATLAGPATINTSDSRHHSQRSAPCDVDGDDAASIAEP